VGGVIALILTPVTLPALWRDRRGRWLLIALLALVPSGWLVAQASLLQDRGRTFNAGIFLYQAALPVGLLASLIGAYWCITKLGLQRFLLLSFTGLLVAAPFFYTRLDDNPWKYGLALPVSMLMILLLARNRLLLGVVVAPLLVAVSITANFRAWVAMLVLAIALAVFARTRSTVPSASKVAALGFVAVATGMAIGWLVTQASAAGILGDYLEQRTTVQLESANGNLLLGGRPEWGAAIALWRENPIGIGIGVAPSSDDYWLAIRSMPLSSRGLQEISVVAKAFKEGLVNFHSTFWTFWGVYGAAGVLFAVLALTYLGRAMMASTAAISSVALRASVALLMLAAIWDILFSPTVVPQLAIALAAALYISNDPDDRSVRAEDSTYETSSIH